MLVVSCAIMLSGFVICHLVAPLVLSRRLSSVVASMRRLVELWVAGGNIFGHGLAMVIQQEKRQRVGELHLYLEIKAETMIRNVRKSQ